MFYDIPEQENDFLRHKTRGSKSRNIGIFPKGINPWFWSKNSHSSNFFFLGNIGQENVFYDILEEKNDFLRLKN